MTISQRLAAMLGGAIEVHVHQSRDVARPQREQHTDSSPCQCDA
jgi:hypothetical protein